MENFKKEEISFTYKAKKIEYGQCFLVQEMTKLVIDIQICTSLIK